MLLNRLWQRQHLAPMPAALIGLVVPHAGYLYSGHTAARAFALLKNRHISTVVLDWTEPQGIFRRRFCFFRREFQNSAWSRRG